MRVLACTPHGPLPHRIHPLTQQSIEAVGCDHVGIEPAQGSTLNRLDDLCDKHNRARQMVLGGDYDAMLHVDADMVVPVDTIQRLMAVNADVAYGLYVSRRDPDRWLCFTDRSMATTLSMRRERISDGCIESYGAGLGCTLIHRHVLERIAFRTDGHVASDWWFAIDAANYGFKQAHDLGCACGHINGDTVLWPDAEAESLYRIERV